MPGSLTGSANYFEDFTVGDRLKHARGTTVGELENQLLTKLVMNTAQAHFNEHAMKDTPFGQRLVFGLVTGSIVMGLATQDIAENAVAELFLGIDIAAVGDVNHFAAVAGGPDQF